VGYLELRYETEFPGGTRIESLDASVVWVLPGPHHAPKDPKARDGRDGPWRYRADPAEEVPGRSRQEDKAVYDVVLAKALKDIREPAGPLGKLVLMSQTSCTPDLLQGGAAGEVPRGLLRAFERVNTRPGWVSAELEVGVPVVLVSWERHRQFESGAPGDFDWKAFYERWPASKGLFWVSGVARYRSHEGTRSALVHVGRMWGFLAGYGTLYRLERKDDRWVITDERVTWIS